MNKYFYNKFSWMQRFKATFKEKKQRVAWLRWSYYPSEINLPF